MPRTLREKSTVATTENAMCAVPDSALERCFWVHNGPVVANIPELKEAVMNMSDEQFAHHVMEHGNDIANWLVGVLGQYACAKKVARARTRAGILRALNSCSC
jgi:hypothetical protein